MRETPSEALSKRISWRWRSAQLLRCATVCSYWNLASQDEALWEPLVATMNRNLELVDRKVLDDVLRCSALRGVLTSKDIFLLTLVERDRVDEGHGGADGPYSTIQRGLYGLADEMKGALQAGRTSVGEGMNSGSVAGSLVGGAAGAVSLGVGGAAIGAVGGAPFGQASDGAQWLGRSLAGAGYSAGGAVGGAAGSVAGGAVGGVLGTGRVAEGLGQGSANLAGYTAAALRQAPKGALGEWETERNDRRVHTSGVHTHERGITWGLVLGIRSFGDDVADAATGLVREPVQGAREGQAAGALKGLGRALVGLVTKPAAGMVDVAGGALRGTGNRLRQCRDGTVLDECCGDAREVRSVLCCSTAPTSTAPEISSL